MCPRGKRNPTGTSITEVRDSICSRRFHPIFGVRRGHAPTSSLEGNSENPQENRRILAVALFVLRFRTTDLQRWTTTPSFWQSSISARTLGRTPSTIFLGVAALS